MDPYLKIVKVKRHFGTTGNIAPIQAAKSLSKSAGKLLFDTGLRIVKKQDKQANDSKARSNAEVITLIEDNSREKAVSYLQAFEETYGGTETEDFTKKQDAYLSAKVQWYKAHELAPIYRTRLNKDNIQEAYWSFPELPESLKRAYAVDMRQHSFDYYEVKLTANMGTDHSTKTRIYKCLKADISDIARNVESRANAFRSKFEFKVREINNTPVTNQIAPQAGAHADELNLF